MKQPEELGLKGIPDTNFLYNPYVGINLLMRVRILYARMKQTGMMTEAAEAGMEALSQEIKMHLLNLRDLYGRYEERLAQFGDVEGRMEVLDQVLLVNLALITKAKLYQNMLQPFLEDAPVYRELIDDFLTSWKETPKMAEGITMPEWGVSVVNEMSEFDNIKQRQQAEKNKLN